MMLRDRIYSYVYCGGKWDYLESQLSKHPNFSEDSSERFVNHFKQKLGKDEANEAIRVFDIIDASRNEKEAKLRLLILGKSIG